MDAAELGRWLEGTRQQLEENLRQQVMGENLLRQMDEESSSNQVLVISSRPNPDSMGEMAPQDPVENPMEEDLTHQDQPQVTREDRGHQNEVQGSMQDGMPNQDQGQDRTSSSAPNLPLHSRFDPASSDRSNNSALGILGAGNVICISGDLGGDVGKFGLPAVGMH